MANRINFSLSKSLIALTVSAIGLNGLHIFSNDYLKGVVYTSPFYTITHADHLPEEPINVDQFSYGQRVSIAASMTTTAFKSILNNWGIIQN